MGAAAEDALPEEDLEDPTPDVLELFRHYDALYFRGALAAADFAVKWGSLSKSSSFGSCTFSKPSNTITMSEPMLKYRSCSDLKKALLHEMIHAIIYVKHHRKDCHIHGPVFRAWMDAINSCSIKDPQRPVSGYNITTRHDFKPEKPFSFKGLLWKCELCGDRLPRAANLGPPSDACCIENVHDAICGNVLCDWHNHKSECVGPYKSMGLQSLTPVQKKVPKGTLLLTYPSETSKSKQAIQEPNSAGLQENIKVTKPEAEDERLSLSSSMKATKSRRSEVDKKARVQAVEPLKEVKQKQDLVAIEKLGLFSLEGCSDAKSLGSGSSKKTGKQHKTEDVQQPTDPSERHETFSLEGYGNGKSLERKSSQKIVRRRRSEVGRANALPDEPPKERKQKQVLVATEVQEFLSLGDCDDATSSGNATSKKASKKHKPEYIQKSSILPAGPQGKLKLKQNLVPTGTCNLFSLENCNDAKIVGSVSVKKEGKQHTLEDVRYPSAQPAASQGKPRLTQELVKTEARELLSLDACNYAKSWGSSTSKRADKQQKPESAHEACSQHAYPLRRLKRDSVAPEKNGGFHALTCKEHEPEDIQKVPGCKPKDSKFVASQRKQGKGRKQSARKKEFAVMCEWMNIYESDRSSGSTEPLVNKRTERRKRARERERIQTYSRSKKVNSASLDNSRIDVLVNSHRSRTSSCNAKSVQQSRLPSPCSHIGLPISAGQVVTQAIGNYSHTSAPCLDIVPLQPADAPELIPPDSAIIDISDDD